MIPGSNKDHPSFLKSFSYAMEGFVTAVKTERNIKVMLVAGVCTVIAGCIVGLDIAEWATVIICCGLVIHGELCNTAMEAIVDPGGQSIIDGVLRPGGTGAPSAGKACEGYRRRLRIRTFHHRRDCGIAGICSRARLYLERDFHVRQYAACR